MKNSCINCGRTDGQVPLIALTFKEKTLHICPQCLPNLIHKPQSLAAQLPGMDLEQDPAHED